MPGIKAFVAAVFGGIGSIPGAFLGGILLGIIENLSKAYISTQLSDAIVFGVLIVVSSPMVCSGYWALSLFLWACLLMVSHSLVKKVLC